MGKYNFTLDLWEKQARSSFLADFFALLQALGNTGRFLCHLSGLVPFLFSILSLEMKVFPESQFYARS